MSVTQSILDDIYQRLQEAQTSPPPKITCKACGRTERGYVPFVWIRSDWPPEERKRREAYNARQQEAIATGNVLCCQCWSELLQDTFHP